LPIFGAILLKGNNFCQELSKPNTKVDMRKVLGSVIVVLSLWSLTLATAFGQMVPPAEFSYTIDKTSVCPGDVVEVTFIGIIPETFHMYSNDYDCPGGGPLPAKFTYESNSTFELVGKAKPIGAKKIYDDIFMCDITEFHHKAEFRQKIKILSANPVIKGLLEYQICTEQGMCVLHEYEIELTGFKAGAGCAEGAGAVEPVNATPDAQDTPDETTDEQTQASGSNVSVDSATLARLMNCLDCGEETEGHGGVLVAADDVNYSSYQKASESDTASCEVKTFEGSSGEDSQSYWGFFIIAFLSGLLALLTPCVFPMIPMTVSFFMKDGSRAKAIRSGLIYALSIVGIYVIAGTIVAATAGEDAAHFLSTHWLPNVFFFLIFVVFAASFFGAFEITLPSSLVNKVDKQADKGGLAGIFFMAFTIVLVSFSCTGPIVGSILVESAGGQFVKPLVGMLGFSLAFAIPFGLFAIFPSWLNNLPQSGGWLNTVKVVLGFLELAFGLKFLSVADQTYHWGILDREVYIGLWIVIFTLMGIYLLGKIKFAHDSDTPHVTVPKLIMAILTFSFVAYLVPGMVGAPLNQLAGYLPPMSTHDFDLIGAIKNPEGENHGLGGEEPKYGDKLHLPHGIQGYFDYEQGMEVARKLGKPVFLDFTGHGCVNCREMEARVWPDPRILNMLQNDYVVISLYTDDKTIMLPENEWYYSRYNGKLVKRLDKKNADIQACYFNANSQPQYALLDNKGELLQPTRGRDLDKDSYNKFLKDGLKVYQKRMTGKDK
jgi:thiol:disulfide interchange protein DsbD